MKPYYEDGAVTIYNGDCREILPQLPRCETIVTDPVWPDCSMPLFGSDNPRKMFYQMWAALPWLPDRAAVQLGCGSDPRFLTAVPDGLPFFRSVNLELSRKGYRGRLLVSGDIGYLFGAPPLSRPGLHVIPGRCNDEDCKGKQTGHPCPRKLKHVKFLCGIWSEPTDTILDPFAGAGTTLRAAKDCGRKAIGIEIEERYCQMAVEYMAQEVLALETA